MADNDTLRVVGTVQDESYSERLRADATRREHGAYPRTVFLGLGGTGAKALQHLRRLTLERFGAVDALEAVAYVSIDTDVRSQDVSAEADAVHPLASAIRFDRSERVNVKVDFASYVGENIIHHPNIREWWDESALPSSDFNLETGAGQIRPLSRLAFFTNVQEIRSVLSRAHRTVTSNVVNSVRVDTESPVRVVIIAGLAGGTGSGMLLDVAALVRDEFGHHGRPQIEGYLVLPGSFGTVETDGYPKIAANGFAALRELNHYLTHPFGVQWEPSAPRVESRGLFDRYVLFTGTNASGQQLSNLEDCYRTIGEILFLDFGAGPMAGWIQGVRVNRQQYLASSMTYTYRLPTVGGGVIETHAERWRNQFSSAGFAKLVFPSWRLINKAKYDLAGEMVALLDPGSRGQLKDLITPLRGRFLFDAGFLEGLRRDGEGRELRHRQVHDRLHRVTGAGIEVETLDQAVRQHAEDLVAMAEVLYADGDTERRCEETWRRVAVHWGDPSTQGGEGDWAAQVRANRRAFVREVEKALPQVVEAFRKRPAVGVSGVVYLLRDILDLLDKPADQTDFRYLDSFKQRRQTLAHVIERSRRLWRRRVENAERAGAGPGRTAGAHRLAVERAASSLEQHWNARIEDLVCEEAVKALEAVRDLVRRQLERVEAIVERLERLRGEYARLADFYARSQDSVIVREIPVPDDISDTLLEPYLGTQPDEREARLQRLLDVGLRRMDLLTLADLEEKLAGEYDVFRDNLSAQAFYALRGENGRTRAFLDPAEEIEDESQLPVAFIERYSILRVLRDDVEDDASRRELYQQLFQKGQPWVQMNQGGGLVRNYRGPFGDAFVGLVSDSGPQEDLATEMVQFIDGQLDRSFKFERVRAHDPSEILFYTEVSAFPVFYPSEIFSLRRHYEKLVGDTGEPTALHLHQDYPDFQAVVPFDQGRVGDFRNAWTLFLRAQIFGLLCSRTFRAGDDRRVSYQWRRQETQLEVRWTDLGREGEVIRTLMDDASLRRTLQQQIEQARERLLEAAGGAWLHLAALADYYVHCIFPLSPADGGGEVDAVGSMANQVAGSLRDEWYLRAIQREDDLDQDQAYGRVARLLEVLAEWAVPVYRAPGEAVPMTPDLEDHRRVGEWQPLEAVRRQIHRLEQRGLVTSFRDSQGNLAPHFPRLALHWEVFEEGRAPDGRRAAPRPTAADGAAPPAGSADGPVDGPPPLAGAQGDDPAGDGPAGEDREPSPRFHYACDDESVGELPLEEIVERVRREPERSHKVWTRSFGREWKEPGDVPAIVRHLEDTPPPLG